MFIEGSLESRSLTTMLTVADNDARPEISAPDVRYMSQFWRIEVARTAVLSIALCSGLQKVAPTDESLWSGGFQLRFAWQVQ